MKLRSTTPIARKLKTRVGLVFLAFLVALSIPIATVQQVWADRWDDQIRVLQNRARAYQNEADKLKAKGDTLQNKLDGINAKKHALELKIKVNKTKLKKLKSQIKANEVKLVSAQDVLGEMLADIYVDDKVSSLELIASSNSIGEYVDRQEYRAAIRDQLNTTIVEVREIKAKLDKDKKEIEAVLADLKRQDDHMAALQAEQQSLVNQTRGQEAAYQKMVSSARNQLESVRAQQQAYYASLGGGGAGTYGNFNYWGLSPGNGAGGCTGGYPYCMAQDTYVDPWNLYNRECVSYVAWALKHRFGKDVQPWHGDGNAYEWVWSAPRWSGAWRVYSPKRGDVVVLPQSGGFAPIGHVMIVESVSGSNMFVSQYNFYGTGQYSTMWIANTGVVLLRFPG